MGIIKSFNEYIKEGIWTEKVDDVYKVIKSIGLADCFEKPKYSGDPDIESPFICSQTSFIDDDYEDEYSSIPIKDEKLDYEDYVFYDLYVSEVGDLVIDDNGTKISLWIEFGENGFADGPEPWCLYYSAEEDAWNANGGIKSIDWEDKEDFLVKLILNITPVINTNTKYNMSYNGEDEEVEDENETLDQYIINYADSAYYDNISKDEITVDMFCDYIYNTEEVDADDTEDVVEYVRNNWDDVYAQICDCYDQAAADDNN